MGNKSNNSWVLPRAAMQTAALEVRQRAMRAHAAAGCLNSGNYRNCPTPRLCATPDSRIRQEGPKADRCNHVAAHTSKFINKKKSNKSPTTQSAFSARPNSRCRRWCAAIDAFAKAAVAQGRLAGMTNP
jgi:hypothetical protein